MTDSTLATTEWKGRCISRFRAVGVADDLAHAEIDAWMETYPDFTEQDPGDAADEMMSYWSE